MHKLEEILKSKSARIGILGGTFDPIHNAHIALCNIAKKQFGLDCVLLLIVGDPPHKNQSSSKEDRLNMAKICVANEPFIEVCTMELERQGKTYTVDTLRQLKQNYPQGDLFYIIGTDTLLTLFSWKEIEQVFSMTDFICFSRPDVDDIEVRYQISIKFGEKAKKIHFADQSGLNISSTEIRSRAAQNLSLAGFLPRDVELYIIEKKLYKQSAKGFEDASKVLASELSKKRYMHSLGVAECAAELAARFGVDIWQARWAGLLHDCAKQLSYKESLKICFDFSIDLEGLDSKALIHAPLGAYRAKKIYNMYDKEILRAIKYHTTGTIGMNKLDKIIYLADSIEPSRIFDGAWQIRNTARDNLDKAVLMAMDYSIKYILNKGDTLHPLTVAARNDVLEQMKNSKEV